MMKIPSEETQEIHHNEGDGYLSDDYEQIEMIPPPIRDGDFSEYMWMENEEEFNSQVLRELEEQELMEECIAANEEYVTHPVMNNLTDSVNNLLLSSNGVRNSNGSSDSFSNPPQNSSSPANQSSRATAQSRLDRIRCPPQLSQSPSHSQAEKESSLNPEAKEFVPTSRPTAPSSEDENEKLPS